MKKLFSMILIISSISLNAQELPWYPGEMYLATANVNPPSQTLTFTIEAQGRVWAGAYPPRTYWITEDYNNSTFIPHANNEWPPNQWRGWDFVTDITNNPPYYIPIYAYGRYKLSTNHSSKYFYLDFRDDRYGYYGWYQPPTYGHDIDLWIKYDASTQQFSYSSTGSAYDPFTIISNGEYIPIWEMKQKGLPSTSLFPLYLTVSFQNGHPYLQWNVYNNPNILGYNIYRKITLGAGGNQTNVIFTTSTSFLDENFVIGPPKNPGNDLVEYWIKAKISSTEESLEGNHVQVVGTSIIQWKISDKERTDNLTYSLNQNYPNPFNPVTTIEFTLKESSIVSLIVFDILGREVMPILNEMLEAGIHQAEFNGSGLNSGIYFYEMRAGNFRDVKKFILLK